MRTRFQLQTIDNDQKITEKDHPQFLHLLESSLLLALKERKILDELQCRYALEKLRKQHHKR